MPAALDQLRVLEVGSGVAAAYAAKLLADLGAQVIKVEPPGGGDATRARGPFPGDVPHPEKSGLFLYLNANKRGITLDLTRPRGREVLERLAARADLLVHDVHPREMAGRGLDYERLSAMHPALVMTSIAPVGLTGPHAGYRGPDVVTWSAGGIAALNGEPARPDLPPPQGVRRPVGLPGRSERGRWLARRPLRPPGDGTRRARGGIDAGVPGGHPRAHLRVLALLRSRRLAAGRQADPAALLHGVPRRVDLPLLRRGAPVEEPGRHHGQSGVGVDGAPRRPPLARRDLRRAPGP